jgi:hypothetical protein
MAMLRGMTARSMPTAECLDNKYFAMKKSTASAAGVGECSELQRLVEEAIIATGASASDRSNQGGGRGSRTPTPRPCVCPPVVTQFYFVKDGGLRRLNQMYPELQDDPAANGFSTELNEFLKEAIVNTSWSVADDQVTVSSFNPETGEVTLELQSQFSSEDTSEGAHCRTLVESIDRFVEGGFQFEFAQAKTSVLTVRSKSPYASQSKSPSAMLAICMLFIAVLILAITYAAIVRQRRMVVSAISELHHPVDDMIQMWMWIPCSKAAATAAVKDHSSGDFLVREGNLAGSFIMIVNDHGNVQSVSFTHDYNGQYRFGSLVFASMTEAVEILRSESTAAIVSKHPMHQGDMVVLRTGLSRNLKSAYNNNDSSNEKKSDRKKVLVQGSLVYTDELNPAPSQVTNEIATACGDDKIYTGIDSAAENLTTQSFDNIGLNYDTEVAPGGKWSHENMNEGAAAAAMYPNRIVYGAATPPHRAAHGGVAFKAIPLRADGFPTERTEAPKQTLFDIAQAENPARREVTLTETQKFKMEKWKARFATRGDAFK